MIRKARLDDLEQLKNIYNDAVLHTVATFDTETKDDANRLIWFQEHEVDPYVLFVYEWDGVVCGYASLSRYHERKAFDKTVEISVYVDEKFRGLGIGKTLVQYTLEYAKNHPDIVTVISLITGENKVSIYMHETLGFTYCGQQRYVGYKHGRWLDLNTYQIVYEEKL
jgi:phosphinothricin acetyltransferase